MQVIKNLEIIGFTISILFCGLALKAVRRTVKSTLFDCIIHVVLPEKQIIIGLFLLAAENLPSFLLPIRNRFSERISSASL